MVSLDEWDWSCRFAAFSGSGGTTVLNSSERLTDIHWDHHTNLPPAAGHIPLNLRISKSAPCSPVKPLLKKIPVRTESFHVVHKVPVGDTPYVKAKHMQLVDKDPERAIALFWAAINAGDRVDSALKDMAIVMKQQNRAEEAIEAVKSLRSRCSDQAQESLDNVLLDLYKRCGRLNDQVALLKHKLHLIQQGMAFNGKRTKTARSQGKKFQVSIEQEATRLLGNLGWAYMQLANFVAAEAVYRKALAIEPDNNKVCNLGICLMKQGRLEEAKVLLHSVTPASGENRWVSDSHLKSYERAQEMLLELDTPSTSSLLSEAVAALNVELLSREQFPVRTFPGGSQLRRGDGLSCMMHQEPQQQQQVVDSSSADAIFSPSGGGFSSRERRNTNDLLYLNRRVVEASQEERPCPSVSMFSEEWDAKTLTPKTQDKTLPQERLRSLSGPQPHDDRSAMSCSTSLAGEADGRAPPGDVGPYLSTAGVARYGKAEAQLFGESGTSRMPLTYDRTNQHENNSSTDSSLTPGDPLGKQQTSKHATTTFRYGNYPGYHTQSAWSEGLYDENRPAAGRPFLVDPFDLMADNPTVALSATPLLNQDQGQKRNIPLLEKAQSGNLLQWADLGLGELL